MVFLKSREWSWKLVTGVIDGSLDDELIALALRMAWRAVLASFAHQNAEAHFSPAGCARTSCVVKESSAVSWACRPTFPEAAV